MERVITPSKDGTFLRGPGVNIELNQSMALVHKLTPRKRLRVARDLSDTNSETSKRGLDWDDQMKLEFLQYWVEYSEVPFYAFIKGKAEMKNKARKVIDLLQRYLF